MKRAFLIFSLVLMTALAGCNDDTEEPTAPIEETGGGDTGGGDTGGDTGGSASTVFKFIA